jgi:GMP synthase (glutamine-hydrolysing)
MKIQVLQHSDSVPPGSILDFARAKGLDLRIHLLHKGDPLPPIEETDWVIALGGEMGVDETEAYPWLIAEKEFLKKALDKKKTCLGICLGGQLLAQTLGAAVKPNNRWEIGWHVVHFGNQAETATKLTVFQWHQDMFDLPTGAVRVATNSITENQAFAFGDSVIGLQFHPEATENWVKEYVESKTLPEGSHVQKIDHMIEGIVFVHPMRRWFFELLEHMENITARNISR